MVFLQKNSAISYICCRAASGLSSAVVSCLILVVVCFLVPSSQSQPNRRGICCVTNHPKCNDFKSPFYYPSSAGWGGGSSAASLGTTLLVVTWLNRLVLKLKCGAVGPLSCGLGVPPCDLSSREMNFLNHRLANFSVRGQIINILGFVATWPLSQVLSSTVAMKKQPQMMCTQMGMVCYNQHFPSETDSGLQSCNPLLHDYPRLPGT